jgi:hypothetical protein
VLLLEVVVPAELVLTELEPAPPAPDEPAPAEAPDELDAAEVVVGWLEEQDARLARQRQRQMQRQRGRKRIVNVTQR